MVDASRKLDCLNRMSSCGSTRGQDVTCSPRGLLIWYGLPLAAIAIAAVLLTDLRLLALTWAGAFAIMSGRCLANARGCGRVHYYFTGPWFLLAALASLLHGFAFLPAGALSWTLIGTLGGLGALALWCSSEAILGRYWR